MTLMREAKSKFRELYARITLTRVTTAFFLFSFIHCFSQGIIQSFLFQIDQDYTTLLSGIVNAAGIPPENITFLHGSVGSLRLEMCNDIPYGVSPYPCSEIFNSATHTVVPAIPANDASLRQSIIKDNFGHGLTVSAIRDASNSTQINGVKLLGRDGSSVTLTQQCTGILLYPKQMLNNVRREDLTFISLQFWLFVISLIAVMNDSVPHTLAVLATRSLLSGWSIYAIWRTRHYERQFKELINTPGSPCSFNLFPEYFWTRTAYEIPDLILNLTALFIASYLSWTLLRVYNAQSFKRVGAPGHIIRINKFFMAVLACLQLEAFVLVTAMCLWLDVLLHTAIEKLSEHTPAYKALFITTTVLLIPWIVTGWYAIRREMKRLLALFLTIAFILIVGWSIMFYSIVYRATFVEWPLLGCFTVASFILIIASMVLAVICRVNFDKGLAQYLHAEATLASLHFSPEVFSHDVEKGSVDPDLEIKRQPVALESARPGSELPMPLYLPTLRFHSDPEPAPASGSDLQPVRGPPPDYSTPYRGP